MPTSSVAPALDGASRVWLSGICLDALTEQQVIDQVLASLMVGRGGWIATPNTYFLRSAAKQPTLRGLLRNATLRIADGAPLVWANKLGRGPTMDRVTGAGLMLTLAQAAARHGRSMYLLGGRDGAAELAAKHLVQTSPDLEIVGAEGPWLSNDVTDEEIDPIIARLEAAAPDIVMVGIGFPKQERFIAAARARLPQTWFLGCGAAINFAAGYERRAPRWMQDHGLEWFHRLIGEPRRLLRRYAADAPFALHMLLVSAWQGLVRRHAPIALPALTERMVIELPDALDLPDTLLDLPESILELAPESLTATDAELIELSDGAVIDLTTMSSVELGFR